MPRTRTCVRLGVLLAGLALVAGAPLLVGQLRERHAGDDEERRERAEGGPQRPADWFWAQRVNADGTWPQARYDAAVNATLAERDGALRASAGPMQWENVGPYNIGGRVTALDATPGGATLWLGAADGGVWKSGDGGANWTCMTDRNSFASIGALAVDPSNPDVVWVGTGEANGSVDSYDGNGLWVTTDAGASWNFRGLGAAGRISSVVVDPADPQHVLVGVMGRQFSTGPDRGLYRTLDGGTTWDQVLFVSDSTGVSDIAMNPLHPDTVFCSTWERVRRNTYRRAYGPECGIWRSVDRGATWTRMTSGLPVPSDDVGRIGLAVSRSRPSIVHAQISSGAASGYVGLGWYRSTDGGTTWTKRDVGTTFRNAFGGFAWYFGENGVDPLNADHVYALGVSMLQSFDGGATWSGVGGSMHVDHHALWLDPASSTRYVVGNDGGLYWTNDGSNFAKSLNLPITQFYAGEVDPTDATKLYGGAQDNSSIKTATGPSGWFTILGGDGFYQLVDPVNPNIVFSEWQYCCSNSGFRRSTTGGPSGATTSGWVSSDRFGWSTPICMDPSDHNVLLAGSQYVYKSTDNGLTWAKVSGDLSTNPVTQLLYGTITTLAISPASSSVYYAGTDDGRVWRSLNAGASWDDISAGLPKRWVTRVVPDPANALGVYVTHSGYTSDDQATLVHRSLNQGGSWTNVSGNLANMPANDLVVDPANPQRLYLATDTGVWTTADGGAWWYALGSGLPLQVIADLVLHAGSRQLFAFTHGRSTWKLDLGAMPLAAGPDAPPARLALSAPWPNPARESLRLTLDLPRNERAEVAVFDVVGRRVASLDPGAPGAGRRTIRWDRRDAAGHLARAGVYYVRATSGGASVSRRVVLAD
ncbi:MAG: T9SS type A sorting domain-containing protein [Candidatus Eisenbacteria bacterium]|nr:T9SS type A sorting domain-containing protein [Candidatus Eisenbacteria bacterium]